MDSIGISLNALSLMLLGIGYVSVIFLWLSARRLAKLWRARYELQRNSFLRHSSVGPEPPDRFVAEDDFIDVHIPEPNTGDLLMWNGTEFILANVAEEESSLPLEATAQGPEIGAPRKLKRR